MAKGTVKWFSQTKGYGFIQPDQGSDDVFVHVSALERAGISVLNDGQKIEYELSTRNGRTSAINLQIIK
jgi:CspA family cold shock protein